MESIVGTWRLCTIQLKCSSNEPVYPFGKNVRGLLIYHDNGYMSGIISGSDRPFVSSPALTGIKEHERAAIAMHFNAYAGRYEIKADKVIHNIEVSFVPNLMKDSSHISRYVLAGDILILSSTIPSSDTGPDISIVISWRRV